LTRWVLSGRYLILAYKITGAPGAQTDAPEHLSVFKLGETGWRATLDLESDPLLLHFADKVKVIQKVVK